MKTNLYDALLKAKEAKTKPSTINFKYSTVYRGEPKMVEAKIDLTNSSKITAKVTKFSGYNENYIKRKLNSELKAHHNFLLPLPKVNEYIRVLNNPDIPTNTTISQGTKYYSVSDTASGGVIFCQGRKLNKSFHSEYVSTQNETCEGGNTSMWYSIYKLTQEL
ncbi:hypothetical protein GN157_00170 [Flavobacterium rakeshii]|uniref:Uncharacterized protein n=1 Tax=Flavobacterium rakeshii TaxID=1038845 RepID=A0A6N8H757_9FLAO|nr:hypothetical protein [Flavobacterium rakeshii]MEE1898056.1 hypothetical protein [Flavobacterium rakeshii]MUV02112.1 hypothetical protein [Flavobacterium rakeshii]